MTSAKPSFQSTDLRQPYEEAVSIDSGELRILHCPYHVSSRGEEGSLLGSRHSTSETCKNRSIIRAVRMCPQPSLQEILEPADLFGLFSLGQ